MRRILKAICAGAAILVPAAALAAIDNTHHDMQKYATDAEKCAYCHSISLASAAVTGYGQVGTFCVVVCHDATIVTGAAVQGPDYFGSLATSRYGSTAGTTGPAVLATAHGMDATAIPAPDAAADVLATNWPHASATGAIECTTCHAVHDGTNPPFLNGPMATGNNATAYCSRCHTGSAASGTAGRFQTIATMGAHPTEFAFAAAGVATGNAAKLARSLEIKATALTAAPAAASISAFNALTTGNAWKTGGHFMNMTTGLPTATPEGAEFGCYTCHSAHQNRGDNTLLIMGGINADLSTMGAGTGFSSNFCTGCHGDRAAAATEGPDVDNPGQTPAWHPTNEESASPYQHDHAIHGAETPTDNPNTPNSGTFPIVIRAQALTNAGANRVGANGEILCVTCHDVHGGVTGVMALRQLGGNGVPTVTATASICLTCHQESMPNNPGAINNYHHAGATGNYTQAANGSFPATLGWTTIDGLGNLADGLSCPDCHVFNGSATRRATAHNW